MADSRADSGLPEEADDFVVVGRGQAAGKHEEVLRGQTFESDAGMSGQRMLLPKRHDQGFRVDVLDPEVRSMDRQPQEAEVDPFPAELVNLRRHGETAQFKFDVRILLPEGSEHFRDDAEISGGDVADRQEARLALGGLLGQGDRPLGLDEGLSGALQELPSGGGEAHLGTGPLEELEPDLLLEVADLPAERGLGDEEPPGCAAEMALLRDCHEVPQMPEFHRRPPFPGLTEILQDDTRKVSLRTICVLDGFGEVWACWTR